MAERPTSNITKALAALRSGKPVLVYDGDEREGEADIIIGARFAEPEIIRTLRCDGGGLICVSIPKEAAQRFGLPFMTDLLDSSGGTPKALVCGKTAYGDKPAFSLAINHRKVYTGITDNDRSLTIKAIDAMVCGKKRTPEDFIKEFYSPGHVFLLIGRGLENRKGHTELSLELAEHSGLGAMVLCEMLGKEKALPKKDARSYASKHGLVFLEGKEIIESTSTLGRKRM